MSPPAWLFGAAVPALAAAPNLAVAQEIDPAAKTPAAEAAAPPLIILPEQPVTQSQQGEEHVYSSSCGVRSEDRADNGQELGKPGLVEDAGSAAASSGGAIAGAAVAGPVGAAVGGVLVDHVGRAIKNVFFGKKHDRDEPSAASGACEQQASASDGNG